MANDLTPAERQTMMRQLCRAAGLPEDEERLNALDDAFGGLLTVSRRLRALDVDAFEPACAFRPLEQR